MKMTSLYRGPFFNSLKSKQRVIIENVNTFVKREYVKKYDLLLKEFF